MIRLDIPGRGELRLKHLVSDYNGTLSCDGMLLPGIAPQLAALADQLEVHVVTADTFGLASEQCAGLPAELTVLPDGNQDEAKRDYINQLGAAHCVCLGNGCNDALMLRAAALGICVLEAEGACADSLREADVVCRSAGEALDLLLNPKRLVSTLRK